MPVVALPGGSTPHDKRNSLIAVQSPDRLR